jgi:hypothetical protein
MYYKLTGREYTETNTGTKVSLQDLPYMVSVGDYVEKFGMVRVVNNIVYLENGGVMLEMVEAETYGA